MLFTVIAATAPAQQSPFMGFLLPIAFVVIFYFFIIRPQQKRNKEHRTMVDALAVSNEVVFAGGLMGKIKKIEGEYAVIALNNNTEIKVQKASVHSVLPVGTIDKI